MKEIKVIKPLKKKPEKITEKRFARSPFKEKIEILTEIPIISDHVRCIVIKDHEGMEDYHYVDDIIDLPVRRFKSMVLRGLVQKYEGEKQANRKR